MDQIYFDSSVSVVDLSRTKNHSAADSPLTGPDPFSATHRPPAQQTNIEARLHQLESENRRLHRLVAELLIKNQQLR